MELSFEGSGMAADRRLVVAPVELDIEGAQRLWPQLRAAFEPESALVLDMSGCQFLDSMGLGVILRAARELDRSGSRLGIAGLRGQPRHLFELSSAGRHRAVILFESPGHAQKVLISNR